MSRQKAMTCGECDHFFDPSDERALTGEHPMCPLCRTFKLDGCEAWASWNDCQGIFGDSVGWSRREAQAIAAEKDYGDSSGCKVVPVRIYVEDDDELMMRDWEEGNKEALEDKHRPVTAPLE